MSAVERAAVNRALRCPRSGRRPLQWMILPRRVQQCRTGNIWRTGASVGTVATALWTKT